MLSRTGSRPVSHRDAPVASPCIRSSRRGLGPSFRLHAYRARMASERTDRSLCRHVSQACIRSHPARGTAPLPAPLLALHDRAVRNEPGLEEPPQRDDQLARHRHDRDPPDPALRIADPHVESPRQTARRAAMAILERMAKARTGDLVFPGQRGDRPMETTALPYQLKCMWRSDLSVHGFRSSFRDWCAERTRYPAEVAEMALAHSVGSAVEQAYRRSDLFERRRQLMDLWAGYCSEPAAAGEVVPIRA
jgi:hypothetical protein